MSEQKPVFHNQLSKNFIILVGLIIGGWFLYYSFAPSAHIVQLAGLKEDGIFEGNGFRIRPPLGWAIGNAEALRVAAIFINPVEDRSKEKIFRSNISVVSEPVEQGLDEYVRTNKEILERSAKSYRSTEYQKTTVNGRAGYTIGGVFSQDGEQLRNRQLIVVAGGIAYIVTGTALDAAWSKYVKQINATLASFDL